MATANLLQTSVSGGTQNALSLQGDGVFFPKASTASRLALTLTTTDKGFVVYDTTDSNIYFWNGTAWESIPGSGDAGANGSVQYNDNGTVSGATNFVYDKATSAVSIAGDLTVDTSTFKVNSGNNNVGIGFAGNASSGRLQISQPLGSTIDGALRLTDDATTSFVFNNVSSGLSAIWSSGSIAFGVGSGTFTEAMRLNSTGNLVLKGGTAAANGVGVTFPATQVASSDANCLDDYEEGTFTPIVGGTATYTGQVGRYTKIGNRVFFNLRIIVLLVGTGSASTISGLPFAAGASTNFGAISVGYFANLALNQIFVSGITNAGSSSIIMNATASSTNTMTLSAAIIGNNTDLAITGFYEV